MLPSFLFFFGIFLSLIYLWHFLSTLEGFLRDQNYAALCEFHLLVFLTLKTQLSIRELFRTYVCVLSRHQQILKRSSKLKSTKILAIRPKLHCWRKFSNFYDIHSHSSFVQFQIHELTAVCIIILARKSASRNFFEALVVLSS